MKARDKLITDHIYVVRIVATKIWNKYFRQNELDDLVQAGMIGLIEAADRFDAKRGFKFNTYAERRIAGSILDSLRKDNFVSRSVYDKHKSLDYLKELLEVSGKDTSIGTMAKIMNMSEKEVGETILLNLGNSKVSIDGFDQLTSREKRKLLVLAGKKETSLDALLKKELSSVLKTLVNSLDGNYRKSVWLYFFEELTMKQIGKLIGVSEARVHQLIKRAMFYLRQNIKKNEIDLS